MRERNRRRGLPKRRGVVLTVQRPKAVDVMKAAIRDANPEIVDVQIEDGYAFLFYGGDVAERYALPVDLWRKMALWDAGQDVDLVGNFDLLPVDPACR